MSLKSGFKKYIPITYFRLFSGITILIASGNLFAQYQFQTLNHLRYLEEEAKLYQTEVDFHTAVRPLNLWQIDSLGLGEEETTKDNLPSSNWFYRKLFHEHLLNIKGDNYHLVIDPVVNLRYGLDMVDNLNTYTSTRGVRVEGKLGKNFSFSSSFLENQARFPTYVSEFSGFSRVIPGQGYARAFGGGARDFAMASGEISYSPNDIFTFSLGQGRNFFGEGYRSMILSDASFNYPFFRIQTNFWKIKYVNIWGQLNDLQRVPGGTDVIFMKKYFTTHYLSFNINSRWNVSLFESLIFGDTAQQRGIDVSFFNPVILYRPVEFAVGSGVGNVLLGFASSYKLAKGIMAYGQLTIDEFTFKEVVGQNGYWANKFAWQLGIKSYNTFGLEGLFTRLEYNGARPYIFTHQDRISNYGHYGQSLAHPWGGNFHEGLFHIVYQKNRWEWEARFHMGIRGLDTAGSNWGADIYTSYDERENDYGNFIGQGLKTNLNYLLLRAAWVVNPTTGLKVEAGYQLRNMNTDLKTTPFSSTNSSMVFIGLRTEFFNLYYDF